MKVREVGNLGGGMGRRCSGVIGGTGGWNGGMVVVVNVSVRRVRKV